MKATDTEQYCVAHSSQHSDICAKIENYTKKNIELPQMLIGAWEASFLQFLVMISKAKRVLEVGTFTGYSAMAMAEVLPADGELVTIDVNAKTTELAKSFWQKSKAGAKIKPILGPAVDAFAELTGRFDLIFLDADKKNIKTYFARSIEVLNPNGIIAVDNSFMDGKVFNPGTASEETRAMAEFNTYIAKDRTDLHCVLINIRDGVYLITYKNR